MLPGIAVPDLPSASATRACQSLSAPDASEGSATTSATAAAFRIKDIVFSMKKLSSRRKPGPTDQQLECRTGGSRLSPGRQTSRKARTERTWPRHRTSRCTVRSVERANRDRIEEGDTVGLGPQRHLSGIGIGVVQGGEHDPAVEGDGEAVALGAQPQHVPLAADDRNVDALELHAPALGHAVEAH